jgi:hypothetical protein
MQTTTPFNIAFLISSAELKEGPRNYRGTIDSYKAIFGERPPIAYIKLPERQKDLLPDIIDHLYDHDVRPIVAAEGFGALILPQSERTKDIFTLLSHFEMARHQYTLFVSEGWRVQSDKLGHCVGLARAVLEANPGILSIAFEGMRGGSSDELVISPSFTSRPAIVRTRDLMLASKLAVDNAAQLQQASSEQAISHMMGMFSNIPQRFLSFNSLVAHSL